MMTRSGLPPRSTNSDVVRPRADIQSFVSSKSTSLPDAEKASRQSHQPQFLHQLTRLACQLSDLTTVNTVRHHEQCDRDIWLLHCIAHRCLTAHCCQVHVVDVVLRVGVSVLIGMLPKPYDPLITALISPASHLPESLQDTITPSSNVWSSSDTASVDISTMYTQHFSARLHVQGDINSVTQTYLRLRPMLQCKHIVGTPQVASHKR